MALETDLRHAIYPRVAAVNASRTDDDKPAPFIVNAPYTPKIKKLSAGYAASAEYVLLEGTLSPDDPLYHLESFGYCELTKNNNGDYPFLPQLEHEGQLFIGIKDLSGHEDLSLVVPARRRQC